MFKDSGNESVLLKIKASYPSLTKAEKKVADYTLANPRDISYMSIADLAEVCKVSLTTVFRFCRELKLDGYQEFRVQLAMDINTDELEDKELLPGKISKNDSLEAAEKKLLKSYITALNETMSLLDSKALQKAAEMINASDQVRFFGIGSSQLIATEGMYKFLHIMPNVYCLADVQMQLMGASTLNDHDTAIFVSNSGVSKEIVKMAQIAHSRGAKTVSITRYPKSPLVEQSDVVLLHGGYDSPLLDGNFSLKNAQTYVLDILFTEVYRQKFSYSKGINALVSKGVIENDDSSSHVEGIYKR